MTDLEALTGLIAPLARLAGTASEASLRRVIGELGMAIARGVDDVVTPPARHASDGAGISTLTMTDTGSSGSQSAAAPRPLPNAPRAGFRDERLLR